MSSQVIWRSPRARRFSVACEKLRRMCPTAPRHGFPWVFHGFSTCFPPVFHGKIIYNPQPMVKHDQTSYVISHNIWFDMIWCDMMWYGMIWYVWLKDRNHRLGDCWHPESTSIAMAYQQGMGIEPIQNGWSNNDNLCGLIRNGCPQFWLPAALLTQNHNSRKTTLWQMIILKYFEILMILGELVALHSGNGVRLKLNSFGGSRRYIVFSWNSFSKAWPEGMMLLP